MLLCIVYDMGQQASWWEKMALSKSLKQKVDRKNRAYKEEWKDNYAVILPSFVNAKKACVSYVQRSDPPTLWMSFRTFQIKSSQFISKSNIAAKTSSYFYFEGKIKTKWLWE